MTKKKIPHYIIKHTTFYFIMMLIGVWLGTLIAQEYTLDEKQNISIYKTQGPGVVNITTITLSIDSFFRAVPSEGSGSGFVIDRQGHIITNFHVIEGARQLTVTLSDNTQWQAKVIGTDPNNDIAIIKITKPPQNLTVLEMADSSKIVVGQKVLALGNPFGLRQTLTTGIISALGRTIEAKNGRKINGVIQSDAAINPGNSGGPLLNSAGKVIGINTQIIGSGNLGIGFSIPINTVKRIIPDLLTFGQVRRPWLGIETFETSILRSRLQLDVPEGILIVRLVSNASAHRAKLRGSNKRIRIGNYDNIPWGGDIITAINGEPVTTTEDLQDIIESHSSGDVVQVQIIRDGKALQVRVSLEQRPLR